MTKGKIKFFNETKGFGFVIEDETNVEHFVHITEVEGGEVKEGDIVEFEVQEGDRGTSAVNVQIIESAEAE